MIIKDKLMVEPLLEAFLSHASKEKRISGLYRKKLNKWGVSVFLAHEDIEGGEEWMKMLKEKIRQCDVFLILLSKKYRKADYTDQETGVAYAFNKTMIPISLDGTKPYGFMSKYQSTKGSSRPKDQHAYNIFKQILDNRRVAQRVINKLIVSFQNATSYAEAAKIARALFTYEKFSKKQINKIAKAVIANEQVQDSYVALPLATNALKENVKKLSPKLQRQLKPYLKNKK